MNKLRYFLDAPYAILAFAATFIATEGAWAAGAQKIEDGGIKTMSEQLAGQAEGASTTVRMVSFGIGTLLIAAGLMKLKQASESNGQIKYSDGIWRLAVGAGLAAVPAVLGTTANTMGLDATEDFQGPSGN